MEVPRSSTTAHRQIFKDIDSKFEAKRFKSKLRVHPKLASCCFLHLLPSIKEPTLPILHTSAIDNTRTDVKSLRDMVKDIRKPSESSQQGEEVPSPEAHRHDPTVALATACHCVPDSGPE